MRQLLYSIVFKRSPSRRNWRFCIYHMWLWKFDSEEEKICVCKIVTLLNWVKATNELVNLNR